MNSDNIAAIADFAALHGRPDLAPPPHLEGMSPPQPNGSHPHSSHGIHEVPPAATAWSIGSLPPIVSIAEWEEDEPQPEEIIEGVLHRRSKMVLGGSSKTWKTWVLMELAIAVATGGSWLGFLCTQGRVLYVNFELIPAKCQQRFRSIAGSLNLSFSSLGDLEVWNLRGTRLDLEQFILHAETLWQRGYLLVIFDPVYKMMGGLSENTAEDVGKLMGAFDYLAGASNAGVVFCHHFSKGNQSGRDAIDRVSGSGVWARDPDSILALTRHEEENSLTVSSILRNHPAVPDFVISWEFPRMRRRDDLSPHRLKRSSRTPTYNQEQVLEVLRAAGAGGLKTGAWCQACSKALGISDTTFFKLKRALEASQVVRNVGGLNVLVDISAEDEVSDAEDQDSPETSGGAASECNPLGAHPIENHPAGDVSSVESHPENTPGALSPVDHATDVQTELNPSNSI